MELLDSKFMKLNLFNFVFSHLFLMQHLNEKLETSLNLSSTWSALPFMYMSHNDFICLHMAHFLCVRKPCIAVSYAA